MQIDKIYNYKWKEKYKYLKDTSTNKKRNTSTNKRVMHTSWGAVMHVCVELSRLVHLDIYI